MLKSLGRVVVRVPWLVIAAWVGLVMVLGLAFPALTKIVKATARDFGLEYREYRTIAGAFIAHLRWMKALGRSDEIMAGPHAIAAGSRQEMV